MKNIFFQKRIVAIISSLGIGLFSANLFAQAPSNIIVTLNPVESGKLWLAYDLTTSSKVDIDLFDINGRKAAIIFYGKQAAGSQLIEWNSMTKNISPGVYILRFSAGQEILDKKIIISKQ